MQCYSFSNHNTHMQTKLQLMDSISLQKCKLITMKHSRLFQQSFAPPNLSKARIFSGKKDFRSHVSTAPITNTAAIPTVERKWSWNQHSILYQCLGDSGTPVLFVHGFGGNCNHFRKNIPVVGKKQRAFAIDLLGYGGSDKPDPRGQPSNSLYCFETWGQQISDFIREVIGEPTVIVCNSVGGLAGLQAAINTPDMVLGVQLLNISLRGLHKQRMSPAVQPLVGAFQSLLRETPLGPAFFSAVAKPETVKRILCEAYGDSRAVTDELVDVILHPGLEPGAASVFLDFISYSGGPLPEELIAASPVPVSIIWGEADPWEDVTLGKRLFGGLLPVTEFITLPGVGHCPQDEVPNMVNPLVERFVRQVSCSA